jgi:hypothetical protein
VIQVTCKTLDAVIAENSLLAPDMLFIDAQGAEYRILESLSAPLKSGLTIIYTEASKEEVYFGARLLDDVARLLEPEIVFTGFAPLNSGTPTHGNALFVRKSSLTDFNKTGNSYVTFDPNVVQNKRGEVFDILHTMFGWLAGLRKKKQSRKA